MKILNLTLKKKWFDLIASGEKTVEYREVKEHWTSRLVNKDRTYKHFDEVHFRNGYKKDSPFMRIEFDRINISFPDVIKIFHSLHGEELFGHQYCIHLGRILEVINLR